MRHNLIPGRNVDHIDVEAGMRELSRCGRDDPRTFAVIEYALQRWKRGEEEAAERGAVDRNFHGISLTEWYRVLGAAGAAGTAKANA